METHQTNAVAQTNRFVRHVIWRSLALTLGVCVLLMIVGHSQWARGLALGGLASVINFIIMAKLLPRALSGNSRQAQVNSLVSVVARFGLMAAALAIALVFPQKVSVFACAAGLLMVQATLLTDRFMGGRLVQSS